MTRLCVLQVGQNGEANTNCRSCGKVVFQMEQTKAEGLVWHKNCFRCVQCSKQLNVDNYESHESTLYCKPHFKELFQPKPVEESDQPGKMITVSRNTVSTAYCAAPRHVATANLLKRIVFVNYSLNLDSRIRRRTTPVSASAL